MKTQTYIKNVRISPKKLRFLIDDVKKKRPDESLRYLLYTNKKGAIFLYDAIKSAINSAKNSLKTTEDMLKFKALIIEEGQKLKRYRPGGKGGIKPFRKRFAHIKVTLEATVPPKKEVKPVVKKVEKKEAEVKVKKTVAKKKDLKVKTDKKS